MAFAQQPLNNPEPIINAVLAALEAQRSALLTNWLLGVVIVGAVILVIGVVVVTIKLEKIQQQTDGMHQALIDATRKLALIEGAATGRAEQKSVDEALSVTPSVVGTKTESLTVLKTTESRTEDAPKPNEP